MRASTYESYAGVVRHHLIPDLGRIRLSRLTPDEVQGMLNRKLEAGLSPRRVDYLRGILHRALNQALRWGLVGRNVAGLVRSPKQVRYEIHPLDPDEVKALLAEVRGDRLEALFVLAIATGMRRGELLDLRWEDVDLPRRVLHVRRALERYQGAYRLVEPKSSRGVRSISLPSFAFHALERQRTLQAVERDRAGSVWTEWGFGFTTQIGLPLDGSMVGNPQNPTGRSFTRNELAGVAAIARARALTVVSDEIHADLTLPGAAHVAFATLDAERCRGLSRTSTLLFASKDFDLAGPRCAVAALGSDALLERFERFPAHARGSLAALGMVVAVATWGPAYAWLQAAVQVLASNQDFLVV